MTIESGPARTDALWHLGRAVLFIGFALWFVCDGAWRWPNKNRAAAEQRLRADPFGGQVSWDQLGARPTQAEYEQLQRSRPTTRAQVRAALGQPSFTRGGEEYFISRDGYGRLTFQGELVTDIIRWVPWFKSQAEIRLQYYWAIIPAIPGLYFLWRLYRAVALRAVVDETGLVYAGRRIPFDQMVALRDYNPKGWIDLYYQAGGVQKRLRLDNEKVARFDEIVDALCAARGFKNEVRAYAAAKARRQADEAAAAAAEEAAGREEAPDAPGGGPRGASRAEQPDERPPG